MLCCGVLLDRALIAGAFLGYGWINDVFQCDFAGRSLVGLYLDYAVNAVNVVRGARPCLLTAAQRRQDTQ